MALPKLTVLLDDGSGTFPTDITGRVMALDGYGVTRGRSDWIGAVTTGELTLTLNNSDGYLTAGTGFAILSFGTGPFGGVPGLWVDQRIRIKETVNGVTYTRFTGYVKSAPVSWPAVVTSFSTVQLTATDAQARAERRTLRSMLEEEILLDGPTAYYTLGEAEGSTSAGDTSGSQAPVLTMTGTGTPVVFGQGTGPVDGLTTATFAGGQWLSCSLSPGSSYSALGAFSRATAPAVQEGLLATGSELLVLETSGKVALYSGIGIVSLATSASSVCDGSVHQVGWSVNAGVGYQLFVDGVTTTVDDVTAGTTAAVVPGFQIGGLVPGLVALGDSPLTGNVSHVAHFDGTVLTSGQVSNIWNIASGLSESGTDRITRLAAYMGLPLGTLDTSLTDVPAQATTGQSAWDAIQEVADAEMGLVFIDGSGNLTFHNRDRVSAKTTPDLILDSQYVTPDVQPVTDDQQIINYFEATASGTGATTLARDLGSEDAHGRYPTSQSYLVATDDEALSRANWIVSKFAEPSVRYGTLTINLYKMTDAQAATVSAALDLNCWLRVTSMAAQNPGGTVADVVVQGWQQETTAEGWTIACNVVSRSLYNAWILGDPVYGVLGTTTILGV